MAVKIRLMRKGTNNRAFYRLVAADERARRNGSILEELGWFNPIIKPKQARLNQDRIRYWLSVGAQLTDGSRLLLDQQGIVAKAKIEGAKRGEKRKKANKVSKAEKRAQAQAMVEGSEKTETAAAA